MWMLKYLVCLIQDHTYTSLSLQGMKHQQHYRYCLRCGKIEDNHLRSWEHLVG